MYDDFKEQFSEFKKKAKVVAEKIGIKKSNLKIVGFIVLASYLSANLAVSVTLPTLIEKVVKSKKPLWTAIFSILMANILKKKMRI